MNSVSYNELVKTFPKGTCLVLAYHHLSRSGSSCSFKLFVPRASHRPGAGAPLSNVSGIAVDALGGWRGARWGSVDDCVILSRGTALQAEIIDQLGHNIHGDSTAFTWQYI